MALSRINSPFNLNLPETPQTPNKEIFNELAPIYQALQTLQQAITTYTGMVVPFSEYWPSLHPSETIFPQNQNRLFPIFSENVAAGAMVNLWNDAGVVKARYANATNNTKPCHGYAPSSVISPANGEVVLFNGLNLSITGMTPGQRYWLNTTNGQIVAGPPVAAGNIEQTVGLALSSTVFYFITDLQFIQH